MFVVLSDKAYSRSFQKIFINDVDWPPYFFIENDSEPKGIGKEIITACFTKNEFRAYFVKLPIKRTHDFMQKGDIDVTVYSYKPEREKFLYYAKEPLFITDYGFMIRANSNYTVNSLDDLQPLRVGHLAGLSYTPELLEIIESKLARQEAVVANSIDAVFSQLLADIPRIDITANTKSTFYWQANILGVQNKVKVLDYTIKTKQYFMTVSKQSKNIPNPELFVAKMDNCVREMKTTGEYNSILAHYQNLRPKLH